MYCKLEKLSLCLIPLTVLVLGPTAFAQEDTGVIGEPTYTTEPAPEPAGPTQPAEQVPPPPPTQLTQPTMAAAPVADGPRFRFGIAFTGGGEFVGNADFTAVVFGIDGRFGVQINDLIGVYVEPHLSFGSGTEYGVTGSTGTFVVAGMADFTFIDTLVVGAGFGWGVMNNPTAPVLALRVGAYPAKSVSDTTVRRRGLVVSLETRVFFFGGALGTGAQIMGAVGYEAF